MLTTQPPPPHCNNTASSSKEVTSKLTINCFFRHHFKNPSIIIVSRMRSFQTRSSAVSSSINLRTVLDEEATQEFLHEIPPDQITIQIARQQEFLCLVQDTKRQTDRHIDRETDIHTYSKKLVLLSSSVDSNTQITTAIPE